jgi:hypothetical protein
MGAILLIVGVSFVIFIGLTLLMKKTDAPTTDQVVEDPILSCGVCHEEFPESEMISRKVGDAGYTRWFCDGCVVDLYQESREMHDPRSKES